MVVTLIRDHPRLIRQQAKGNPAPGYPACLATSYLMILLAVMSSSRDERQRDTSSLLMHDGLDKMHVTPSRGLLMVIYQLGK